MTNCPQCGTQVESLVPVDQPLQMLLQAQGTKIANEVCSNCLNKFQNKPQLTGTSLIVAQEKSLDERKLRLWRSRIQLLTSARKHMMSKRYADAAATYEKYIKILELVFDIKKGGRLTPEIFKDSARTQELTVVTNVFWDLVRIYDNHPAWSEKQKVAAEQLASFLGFTPVYLEILRKAETFLKKSNNPGTVKMLIRKATASRAHCFIATETFASPFAPEVIALRRWRDNRLIPYFWGRLLVKFYYLTSPSIARILRRSPQLRKGMKKFLGEFIKRFT